LATGADGDQSETYMFNYKVREFKYCEATGSSGTGSDYINFVSLEGMVNASGQDYYGDFTDSIIALDRNQSYTLEVGMNYHWDSDSVMAWIDYNYDATFSEDEKIILSELDAARKCTATFTVPATAALEKNLRMRVRSQYYSNVMDPCDDKSGEVEDYTIVVSDANASITKKSNLQAEIFPNPNNGTFEIKLPSFFNEIHVEVLDMQGKVVWTQADTNANAVQVISNLARGQYLVKINTESGSLVEKLVIQ
jgi:hypothetical protein